MNLAARLLKWFGWTVRVTVPDFAQCIICVAPHTTNWDFILGKLAYASVGRKAGFLMKSSWFFFPLGIFFRAIGGIPVERKNKRFSLTDFLIEKFKTEPTLTLAITPEGTRSRVSEWHTGFLHIAYSANIPIVLGVIGGGTKSILVTELFKPTGNADADMVEIKKYYSQFTAIYPDRFTTE